uniref:Uncharacterized protein n=1 Tax=Rhodnius prolixus TaxID=13249 RepID=T1H9F5_RHOPR
MTLRYEIQVILRHYWKRKFAAAVTNRLIREVEEESNLTGTGRPSAVNSEALRHAIEDDPTKSTRQLSSELGLSQSSVNCHLQKLGKVKRGVIYHEFVPVGRSVDSELYSEQLHRMYEVFGEAIPGFGE